MVNEAVRCQVCGGQAYLFDEAVILRRHRVKYFRCIACGFVQTEEPWWLEEAYSEAIARQDVGICARNLVNVQVTTAVLTLLFEREMECLDFGGGHGMFVRMMRDRGFSFHWQDRYARNDYARGFEREPGKKYGIATAFEVLEHLPEPYVELAEMMATAENVFCSTVLLPEPAPKVGSWWYYAEQAGQHVSLYTLKALQTIAAQFGKQLLTHGPFHLFTSEPKSTLLFNLATRPKIAMTINLLRRHRSLTASDLQQMLG